MEKEYTDLIIIIVVSTLTLLLLVTFIVLFLFVYQKRVYRHKRQVQKMEEDFKEELLTSKMELQEQVLSSVSEEMHDNLGQMLSVVKLNLAKLGRMAKENEQESIVIDELRDQVSSVITDVRDISKTLSKDFIANFGLVESLKLELDKINRTGEIRTELNSKGEDHLELDGQSQIVLFRIAQELINNAIKHSEATKISIALNFNTEALQMKISDNGVGFDPESLKTRDAENSGNGLRNMQNRVNIIGGILTLKSEIGKGTQAKITIDNQSSLFKNSKKL